MVTSFRNHHHRCNIDYVIKDGNRIHPIALLYSTPSQTKYQVKNFWKVPFPFGLDADPKKC